MNRLTRWCAPAAITVALIAAAGCGSDSTTSTSSPATDAPATTAAVEAEVTVADPWARTSPMSTSLGAAYMTLTSNAGDTLLGASVPTSVAGRTEIHETTMAGGPGTTAEGEMDGGMDEADGGMDGGMDEAPDGDMENGTSMPAGSGEMEMRPIDALELPAGEAVEMKPGGYHIMMLDLVEPLVAGATVEITLTFEKAGEQVVTATVRDN